MAACLILLTAAFPVLNYVLPRIGISIGGRGGNAGAGTSELEAPTQAETQALETEDEKIDSPYPRAIDAYPADMPAEEIYADVLKGGWVVNYDFSEIEAGEDLWLDFLNKVDRGEPARILIATYPLEYPDGTISIELHEVVYDGKLFTHTGGSHRGIDSILKDFNIFRFEYLTKIEHESNNRKTIKWMLTHKNPYTYEDFGDEFMSNNGGIGDHESIMSFYYYKN